MSENTKKTETLETLNREMADIIRGILQKKQINGLCYGCGSPKKILFQNACILPLAVEGDDAFEITIGVACSSCGAITQFLSSILFSGDEVKQLDDITKKMREIMEKKEG